MKSISVATSLLFTTVLTIAIAVAVPATKDKDALVKITKERIPMAKRTMRLCAPPNTVVGPHAAAEVDVFVNDIVLQYRKENPEEFSYPVGSIFVKKKYPKIGAKDPDIATIMIRKENNGTIADWEFSMESLPDHKPISPTGRVTCASCHERYEERGFVSRESETALRQFLQLRTASAKDSTPQLDRRKNANAK